MNVASLAFLRSHARPTTFSVMGSGSRIARRWPVILFAAGALGACGKAGPGVRDGAADVVSTTDAPAETGAGGQPGSGGEGGLGGFGGFGGAPVGGSSGSGGAIVATAARIVQPFDADWRFTKGDPAGAQGSAFADSSWRVLDVPHDWSIEGPYDQANPTGAAGGFLPAGVGWYRKHFTLPSSFAGKRIFIELDGVMANSTVYLNGTSLGTRPNGYVSFRYEMTSQAKLGGDDNVLAVRVDNSVQPASRWYAGAGIYRHTRLIVTSPIHTDKRSTYVTTPSVTAAAATVHLATTVVNQGTSASSVAVQATVVTPSGTRLPAVTTQAKSIAAAGSADFALDVTVPTPVLWTLDAPKLYQVETIILAESSTVDDEKTDFGIRTIAFDPVAGFSLNGKSLKLKGVCLHHDMSGLGVAVPQRAMQRRLAILKGLGVNAIRTSHNPVAPEVLDLFDRMGFLVMDELFDAWTAHKEPGDYATYFKTWSNTDLGDTLKRDRNHPSIVLYSIGNEIRDSLSTRLPIAKTLVALAHSIDPTRPVTQALFRPKDNGDYPGAMLDILDVFGANYRLAELIEALALTPKHAGVLTEKGPDPSDWTTISGNPQVTGEFVWTGADYLGEAGSWPSIGFSTGLIDRVGTVKDMGYRYQAIWSSTPVVRPKTSAGPATKIVLTVDHPVITTDWNDIAYVKASLTDAAGAVVTAASNPVTFALAGSALRMVAVDSGVNAPESYRGTTRNAFQGIAFALVQGTAAGSGTITASSPGLSSSSVTITANDEPFVPCSGSCD